MPNKKIPLLILFRHGQTDYNAQKRFQGQLNCALNMNGFMQVNKTGEHISQILADIFTHYPYSKIIECVTSDLQRSYESAQIIKKVVANNLKIELNFMSNQAFREYHAGDLQDYTIAEYMQKKPESLEKYFADYKLNPWEAKYPGMESESWKMVSDRIAPYLWKLNTIFKELKAETSDVDSEQNELARDIYICSTHGGVIRNLLTLMHIVDFKHSSIEVGNGDILILEPHTILGEKDKNQNILFEKSFEYQCDVAWDLMKHVSVGDAVTVLTDISDYIK